MFSIHEVKLESLIYCNQLSLLGFWMPPTKSEWALVSTINCRENYIMETSPVIDIWDKGYDFWKERRQLLWLCNEKNKYAETMNLTNKL